MSNPIIVLDAGHGLKTSGKEVTLAGWPKTKEWWLNDRIADKLEKMLANYDCRVIRADDTTGANDVSLANRVKVANNGNANVYVSIHHNAGIKGGNGGGTVVYYYPSGDCKAIATRLYNSIVAETGLRGNRGTPVADGKSLYVIKKTKMVALLIENGFMDSATDVPVITTDAHAQKTAQGILNFLVKEYALQPLGLNTTQNTTITKPNTSAPSTKKYVYGGVDYSLVFDPVYYSNKYPDLKKAFGNNVTQLLSHFIIYGINEGRQAKSTFNVRVYRDSHADLQRAFGNDLNAYVQHYLTYGCNETNRKTV